MTKEDLDRIKHYIDVGIEWDYYDDIPNLFEDAEKLSLLKEKIEKLKTTYQHFLSTQTSSGSWVELMSAIEEIINELGINSRA